MRRSRLIILGAASLTMILTIVTLSVIPAGAAEQHRPWWWPPPPPKRSPGGQATQPPKNPTKPPSSGPSQPAPSQPPGNQPPAEGVPAGFKLTFSDEFNGAARTSPDRSKWVFDIGGEPQWGNEEWEYYTNRTDNVSMDGSGNLAITARKERLPGMANCEEGTCDITSGRIKTAGKFTQKYGRFEARIKVPKGQGMWPAFWMLGANVDRVSWPACGEIDIMETTGKSLRTVEGTAHANGFGDDGIGGERTITGGDLSDAFHTFAVEWDAKQIAWFLDGTKYFTFQKSQLRGGQQWAFDQPFFMLLNLAVGGEMPGSPNASTKYPATMLVDYVRVYSKA